MISIKYVDMIEYTTRQKEIINNLLHSKSVNNLEELRSSKLLRKNIDAIAISWNSEKKESISVYSDEDLSKEVVSKKYLELFDLFYFIKHLEDNEYIILQEISALSNNRANVFYDTEHYTLGDPLRDSGKYSFYLKDEKGNEYLTQLSEYQINICKYAFKSTPDSHLKVHQSTSHQMYKI